MVSWLSFSVSCLSVRESGTSTGSPQDVGHGEPPPVCAKFAQTKIRLKLGAQRLRSGDLPSVHLPFRRGRRVRSGGSARDLEDQLPHEAWAGKAERLFQIRARSARFRAWAHSDRPGAGPRRDSSQRSWWASLGRGGAGCRSVAGSEKARPRCLWWRQVLSGHAGGARAACGRRSWDAHRWRVGRMRAWVARARAWPTRAHVWARHGRAGSARASAHAE